MAEEKKPGTGDTAPGKAAARKKTRSTAGRAKASVKKEEKVQKPGTAAKATDKTESQIEKITETSSHKEEKRMEKLLFTSESVTEGHPDKVCDQISDAILDECFKQDPNSRVACECFATTNLVVIGGEITTNAKVDYEAVARNVLKENGYDDEAKGMDYRTCKVEVVMDSQSSDIALGTNEEVGGAGDQGIMFGYATKETEGYMPLAISIAHHLVRYASTLRHDGTFKWARPDMKAQVTIDYTDEKPVIDTILMSIQHDDDFDEAGTDS